MLWSAWTRHGIGLAYPSSVEILQLLGVAVGLATLAGLNLYLVVFLTGLAIRYDWISLSSDYARLEVLADPVILILSGLLFAMEFLADKLPWVDSAWDAVHTVIRPVGAALLAIMVLGDSNPIFEVAVGLVAAWLGFTTHAFKSTIRLQANASPEPVSNILLSVAEDATVVLGLGLVFVYPQIALIVAVIFLAAIWWFVPRMLRSTYIKLWLCGSKLRLAPEESAVSQLPQDLPASAHAALVKRGGNDLTIEWAVPCISGVGPGYRRNRFGWLVSTAGIANQLWFISRSRLGQPCSLPPGLPWAAHLKPKFLADILVLQWSGQEIGADFLFDRGSRELAHLVVAQFAPLAKEGAPLSGEK